MAYLICATDFKDAAYNACRYASQLAMQMRCRLVIVHARAATNKVLKLAPKPDAEAEAKLTVLVREMMLRYPAVAVSGSLVDGNFSDGLGTYVVKNGMPLLVVAGNNYDSENPAYIDGNLLQIFRYLDCPVLAIPPERTFKPVKKICFAYDNQLEGAEQALRLLTNLATEYNMELHIVIGWASLQIGGNVHEIHAEAKKIAAPASPTYHFIAMMNLDEGIGDFVLENGMDWLVMLSRKNPIFGKTMYRTDTDVLVNSAHMPILALHEG